MNPQPPKQTPHAGRRAPRFSSFLLTGGLAGLMIGIIVSVVGPVDSSYGPSAAMGFLGLIGVGLGMLAGGALALLLDRRC